MYAIRSYYAAGVAVLGADLVHGVGVLQQGQHGVERGNALQQVALRVNAGRQLLRGDGQHQLYPFIVGQFV